ncbi:peptide deformylase [Pavlovales sp. CCMP2436]|nr:peptide deformylase [Pavlovales sp. CCMP2436]|mmetsp:Transcript_11201/g.28299  ORF Transcript_11201/g.28299 Transcript_11201/m.28299 type:complete len:213 (+) Transcript_11201:83-721(+)
MSRARVRFTAPPRIVLLGHPALRRVAAHVDDVRSPEVKRVVRLLLLGLDAQDGSGLAAPQIGESRRIIAIRDLFNRLEGKEVIAPHLGDAHRARLLGVLPVVAINPVITASSAEEEEDWEACLSLPALHGLVSRPKSISVRFTTVDGDEVEHTCTGWGARVFRHEMDHLDGTLFVDKLRGGAADLVHESEISHHLQDDESAEPTADESPSGK